MGAILLNWPHSFRASPAVNRPTCRSDGRHSGCRHSNLGNQRCSNGQPNYGFAVEWAQFYSIGLTRSGRHPPSTAQPVEVTGATPVVDTATSGISDVVMGSQITDLPLNGRNFTQLASLVPGVTRRQPPNLSK